jgi:chromosome segregation ATPase
MNGRATRFLLAGWAALGAMSLPGQAASGQLSPERLDLLDQRGYFTPAFKKAVHDLVDARQALQQAEADVKKLSHDLPDLESQAAAAQAKATALRQELARYDHPEENDFDALQKIMNDTAAKPEHQIALAQAYVWTYPTSPHESEAQQILQQLQKKLADEIQAEKDAEAARVAAHAKLVQRAQAKDLSLLEWRDFLRDMSQDDLVKLLGRPTSQSGDYWTYSGAWLVDPATHQKIGMVINFNAGRVLTVSEETRAP